MSKCRCVFICLCVFVAVNNEFFGARLLFVPFSVCQPLPPFHHPYLFHFQPLTFCHFLLLNVTSPFYDRYFVCYFKPISFFFILNKNIFLQFLPTILSKSAHSAIF